jgi:hypothetical protein
MSSVASRPRSRDAPGQCDVRDTVVTEVLVAPGATVDARDLLVVLEG